MKAERGGELYLLQSRSGKEREREGMAQLTKEQTEFQQYARAWLAENKPEAPSFRLPLSPLEVMTIEQKDYLQQWQGRCYEAKLIGSDYPKAYGGHGLSGCQRIANQELGRAGVPFMINVIALNMAAPTILHHGTEEQKRRFIPGCLSAKDIWCQGFSEPEAGSDLANAQTWCELSGDKWIVNGHKVWTSLGHFAQWMILLARTSRDDKYRGLTYFICQIEGAKGVTVRPLIKITGETGFNEVLFENAEIADDMRLDKVGAGWQVAMTTLLHERGAAEGAGGGGRLTDHTDKLIALAKRVKRDGVNASDDPVTRDQIIKHVITAEAIHLNNRRARVGALCDHPMRLPLQTKVSFSEFEQDVDRLGCDLAGALGQLYKLDERAPDHGHWPLAYMNSYGMTIAAGTSEIQRNILGERVLGMEKGK
jgi:alkylation response protein AidB-like acyl-CoA dehydrogenase